MRWHDRHTQHVHVDSSEEMLWMCRKWPKCVSSWISLSVPGIVCVACCVAYVRKWPLYDWINSSRGINYYYYASRATIGRSAGIELNFGGAIYSTIQLVRVCAVCVCVWCISWRRRTTEESKHNGGQKQPASQPAKEKENRKKIDIKMLNGVSIVSISYSQYCGFIYCRPFIYLPSMAAKHISRYIVLHGDKSQWTPQMMLIILPCM